MTAASPVLSEARVGSPLDAFTGNIRQPRLSPAYTAGLAIVAFAMVLLPAIYIGLIVLVGYGLFYHLGHDFNILSDSGSFLFKLVFYFGPLIAGLILIFFMLKPLFARRQKQEEPVSLDPAKEKLLFAFVQRICQLVGAPMPSRIDVDCQVNASAGLRRGLWSRDLVLTIGLPLAAGLDMRQFAGVLAHEFGHFAQGAGMRLTYVIRNINLWFARVVYERDQWDVDLEHSARNLDFRVGIILHGARGCVWVTRRILWALMHAGTAISCFMLRQMEYDADGYETKLAGSEAFESTATRLRVLNVATQVAFEDVRQGWAGKRLPENLPLLIGHKAGTLEKDVHQKLAEAATVAKTRWFHTHPCDNDRIRAARAHGEAGVFRLERPATELFADFAATSRLVTRHQYQKAWALEFSEQNLVSSDEMLRESAANAEADAVVRRYYGKVNISLIPLFAAGGLLPLQPHEAPVAQWRAAREQADQLRPAAEAASAEYVRQQQVIMNLTSVRYLSAAGFAMEAEAVGLPTEAHTPSKKVLAAHEAIKVATQAMEEHAKPLNEFMGALRVRLSLALQARAAGDASFRAEVESLVRTLAVVAVGMPGLQQLGVHLRAFTLLAQNRPNHASPQQVETQMSIVAEELQKLLTAIQAPFGSVPYPFPHSRGQLTVAEYARYEKASQTRWETIYQECNAHLDRLFPLHYRLLGRLLVLAAQAEQELEQAAEPVVAVG